MHNEPSGELLSLLLPLHYFYAQEDLSMPQVELLDGSALPEPQQELLVHDRDMTSTLRRFHEADIALSVLKHERSDDYLIREVVLSRTNDGVPVEYGAIGVRLEKFEGALREDIAEARGPLGGLLEKYVIDYRSAPKGYFKMIGDERIATALGEPTGKILYGRCNELTDPDGIAFADIVEVLPSDGE